MVTLRYGSYHEAPSAVNVAAPPGTDGDWQASREWVNE
jgi:hypothetical protein